MLLPLALAVAVPRVRHSERPARRPNVLLVTIDTLRADHVGCYGDAQAQTPVLDGLAARGVRFATAVAHAPLTAPSHASILTGLIPVGHGVRDNGGFVLPPEVATLADAFRRAGYRTAAFISGFPLDHRFGFDRGFDVYDDRLPRGSDPRRGAYVERPADVTTDRVLGWLFAAPGPWFAWVHFFDPHAPYEPPAEAAARTPGRPYDGEVTFVDTQLGRVVARVQAMSAPAVVLVTADHGESLGEHGEDTHGVFLYDSTLRVPFLLAGPAVPAGGVSSVVARGVDVAPTLLDLAGLPAMAGLDGRSLRAAAEGRDLPDAPAYAESLYAALHLGWAPLRAWRTAAYKYIDAPWPELYDLAVDPGETHDATVRAAATAATLRRALFAVVDDERPARPGTAAPDTTARLAALGYFGGTASARGPRRDPKTGIALVQRLERAMTAARVAPAATVRDLTAVLVEEPDLTLARRYRAIALAAAGNNAAAVKDLRALEDRGALAPSDLVLLGDALRRLGHREEAERSLQQAARRDPRSPDPPLALARLRRDQGRRDEAAALYRAALVLSPGHPEALRGQGDLALETGDLVGAADAYAAVVTADPADVPASVALGVVRVRQGDLAAALALFEGAARREPANAEALLDLAGALAKAGRPAEAVPYFERALAAGPSTTAALNGLAFARLESGDPPGALSALRASLALDPRQPRVAEAARTLGSARPRR